MSTTAAAVLDAIETVLLATTLTTNANFGAPTKAEDDMDARTAPRATYVEPVADGPTPGSSGGGGYRRLRFEAGWTYPRDSTSRAIMLADGPILEIRIRNIVTHIAALSPGSIAATNFKSPVTIEGEGEGQSVQVRINTEGTRYGLIVRGAIDYLYGSV